MNQPTRFDDPDAPEAAGGGGSALVETGAAIGIGVAVIALLNFGSVPGALAANAIPLVLVGMAGAAAYRWWRGGLVASARTGAAAKISEFGGGLYGTVAVATWLYLELTDLVSDYLAAGGPVAFFESLGIGEIVGDAVRFGLDAMLWPFYWFDDAAILVMALAWSFDGALHALRPRLARWRQDRARAALLAEIEAAVSPGQLASSEEKP